MVKIVVIFFPTKIREKENQLYIFFFSEI